ncbi:acyl-CoA dehydrogenase family protein [Stetteria hydrogenophila]
MPASGVEGVLSSRLPGLAGEIDRGNLVPRGFLEELAAAGAFEARGPGELFGLVRLASRWSPAVGHVILVDGVAKLGLRMLGFDPPRGSLLAIGVTEPGGGSDVRGNLETRAEEAGGEARVYGRKAFMSNGLYATHYLVLARGPGGETLYLAEAGEGVSLEPVELSAMRGAGVANAVFNGARAVRVGAPGRGLREALEVLNYGRAGYAAVGLGIADGALEAALSWASQRAVFGRRLLDYQGVRWMLAEVRAEALAVEALLERLAGTAEASGAVDPEGAAAVKLLAARLAQRAAWVAVQLMGGRGLERWSRVERLQRDARALDIGEGAREVLLDFIASRLERSHAAGRL